MIIERYYDWIVLSHDVPRTKSHHAQVFAECVLCGTKKIIQFAQAKRGLSRNCGCLRSVNISKRTVERNTVHGLSGTRLHNIWKNVRQRCSNPKASGYKNYGGKGIRVTEEWGSYENFYSWAMANGYEDPLTIDRLDSSKDYEPNNCQWITKGENTAKRNKEYAMNKGGFLSL